MRGTSEPLPPERLAQRHDAPWERTESRRRIKYAKRWATRRAGEILAAQALGGDPSDKDFMDRVDAMYAGLRDRLTRQDLLRVFMDHISPAANEHADQIRASFDAEVDSLIGEPQWSRAEQQMETLAEGSPGNVDL